MADVPRVSARNLIPDSTVKPLSISEKRRVSRDAIQRLEHIVTVQEDRVKTMRHRSIGSPSLTRRLQVLMKENLITYRNTLQYVRQTAETLEVCWSAIENGNSLPDTE
ncbi:MAG: hypothetical protein OJF51_000128 [Nitrospira sp.]|jgi:hypothetical protein|nr:MAG: hypothetical protein OJF51_000128 [Nitrospira sp.]